MKKTGIFNRNFVPYLWWSKQYPHKHRPFESNRLMKEQKENVFIVEDSTTISNILKKVISNVENAHAHDFLTGENMLEKIEELKPKLIFLDYYLDTKKKGYMNGEEVFYKLKTDYPNIPVVMITGMTDDKKLEELNQVGFDKIIHKDHDQLFEEVQNCVKKYTS